MRIHKITMDLGDGRDIVFPEGMVRHVEATLMPESDVSWAFDRARRILYEPTTVRVLIELDVPAAYWQFHQTPEQIEAPRLQISPED